MDVVVRTKKLGHFFPAGTVDAFDTWLELKGTDERGQVLFWSGMVEDNGKGPGEKWAHFYRSHSHCCRPRAESRHMASSSFTV